MEVFVMPWARAQTELKELVRQGWRIVSVIREGDRCKVLARAA